MDHIIFVLPLSVFRTCTKFLEANCELKEGLMFQRDGQNLCKEKLKSTELSIPLASLILPYVEGGSESVDGVTNRILWGY